MIREIAKNIRVRVGVEQFLFKYNSSNLYCRVKGDFGSVHRYGTKRYGYTTRCETVR